MKENEMKVFDLIKLLEQFIESKSIEVTTYKSDIGALSITIKGKSTEGSYAYEVEAKRFVRANRE